MAEAMRIDASGNLLVGKSASSFTTAGVELAQGGTAGKVQIMRASGGLTVVNTTNDGAAISIYKGTTAVGSIGNRFGAIYIHSPDGTNGAGLRFFDGVIQPCESNGNDSSGDTDLGQTNSRFKDLYLSGGAYLGGTAAANKLDDYEEGNWVPTFHAYTGSLPSTLTTTTSGTYTKVGRMVSVIGYVQVDSVSGASTNIINIRGLPFTALIGNGYHSVGALTASSVNFARTVNLAITVFGTTELGFLTSNNNAGWGWEYFNVLNNGSFMRFEITYYTTQ
jgi:hypothetical protein